MRWIAREGELQPLANAIHPAKVDAGVLKGSHDDPRLAGCTFNERVLTLIYFYYIISRLPLSVYFFDFSLLFTLNFISFLCSTFWSFVYFSL